MTRLLVLALVLPPLFVACASSPAPAVEPEITLAELTIEARKVPLTKEACAECRAAWTRVLDRAITGEDRIEALWGIAVAWSREGLLNQMQAGLEEIVLIPVRHPLRTRAFYTLAFERHRRGDVAGALAALEAFLFSDPVDRAWTASAWLSRADWLLELGHPERAREVLRSYVEVNEATRDPHALKAVKLAAARLEARD